MITNHEKEIFSQELQIPAAGVFGILNSFLQNEFDFANIEWDIEVDGVKNFINVYNHKVLNPDGKSIFGFVEINPTSSFIDNLTRVRIVSLMEEVDIWWLNLAHLIQAIAIAPNFDPNIIANISKELTANIIHKHENLAAETLSKPEPAKAPKRPEVPKKGHGKLDEWFKYFQDRQKSGPKYTLEDLAEEIGYSYGYIRQLHAIFVSEPKDLTKSDKI